MDSISVTMKHPRFRVEADEDDLRWGIYQVEDGAGKKFAAKGKLNEVVSSPGVQLNLFGKWVNDPRYGRQYEFSAFSQSIPFGERGVKSFLESCPNIGTVTADKIYDQFGNQSIEKIISDPAAAAEKCNIPEKVAEDARTFLAPLIHTIKAQLPLVDLFSGTKIPQSAVDRAIKEIPDACETLKKNPFELMKLKGIGFRRCDSLRRKLKMPASLFERKVAACIQTFQDSSDQTWLREDQITAAIRDLLEVDGVDIEDVISSLVASGTLIEVDLTWYALKEYRDYEQFIANDVARRMMKVADWPMSEIAEDKILTDHQKNVALGNISGSIMLLPGSPGVGKTLTLARIIKAYRNYYPDKTVAAAAPTGKAAQRLTESLASNDEHLEATTIHRMLEPRRKSGGGFYFQINGNGNYVNADLVAIDESSMLNNELAYHLLRGISPDTAIIFVGDRNQLPPVGPGTMMRDLQELHFDELKEIRRNEGRIVRLCADIRDGKNPAMFVTNSPGENVTPETNAQIVVVPKNDDKKRGSILKFLQQLKAGEIDNVMDPLEDVQFLCATHKNSHVGRVVLNQLIRDHLNPRAPGDHAYYKVGDKVICTKNNMFRTIEDGTQFVANGEIGRVVESHKNYIGVRMSQNQQSIVLVPTGPGQGKGWDHGFCITTHKAQGSEWPVVVTVLGSDFGTNLVTSREWIYTALSRAKYCSIFISPVGSINEACARLRIWDRKSFLLQEMGYGEEARETVGISGGYEGTNPMVI